MKKYTIALNSQLLLSVLLFHFTPISMAQESTPVTSTRTLQIEIWSDVVCPFCYIGKRKLEKALKSLNDSVIVQIEWKSFLLNPALKSNPDKTIYRYLSESKGWSEDYARNISQQVVQMAQAEGLHYNFDKVVVANSLKAHQLIQFAKTKGKVSEAEEMLFEAYFIKGINIDDQNQLEQIGQKLGFELEDLHRLFREELTKNAVQNDLQEAENLKVNAVPYFIFNRKIALSGAQDSLVFKKAIEKALN